MVKVAVKAKDGSYGHLSLGSFSAMMHSSNISEILIKIVTSNQDTCSPPLSDKDMSSPFQNRLVLEISTDTQIDIDLEESFKPCISNNAPLPPNKKFLSSLPKDRSIQNPELNGFTIPKIKDIHQNPAPNEIHCKIPSIPITTKDSASLDPDSNLKNKVEGTDLDLDAHKVSIPPVPSAFKTCESKPTPVSISSPTFKKPIVSSSLKDDFSLRRKDSKNTGAEESLDNTTRDIDEIIRLAEIERISSLSNNIQSYKPKTYSIEYLKQFSPRSPNQKAKIPPPIYNPNPNCESNKSSLNDHISASSSLNSQKNVNEHPEALGSNDLKENNTFKSPKVTSTFTPKPLNNKSSNKVNFVKSTLDSSNDLSKLLESSQSNPLRSPADNAKIIIDQLIRGNQNLPQNQSVELTQSTSDNSKTKTVNTKTTRFSNSVDPFLGLGINSNQLSEPNVSVSKKKKSKKSTLSPIESKDSAIISNTKPLPKIPPVLETIPKTVDDSKENIIDSIPSLDTGYSPSLPKPIEKDSDPKSSSSVYIENLDPSVTKSDLLDMFIPSGYISNIALPRKGDRLNMGFALIEFGSQDQAQNALSLNGTLLNSKHISVKLAMLPLPKKLSAKIKDQKIKIDDPKSKKVVKDIKNKPIQTTKKPIQILKNNLKPNPKRVLMISGLNFETSKQQLMDLASNFGDCVDIKLPLVPENPEKNIGCAFIQFKDLLAAQKAFEGMNGYFLDHRVLSSDYCDLDNLSF
ncbi:Multiple RNA-binding domain-containing protein 1 [Smittium mucronatum]|uniref:Multiple RNA-binding domain-containing protein 1 n=1 Tax=Smittium mucronatum TaxID=133383 RepID=A0A1R0H3B9_9FUNG|nr:Multiple RNA-binding domain-containing protein 1 [Smittium mucronatum]